MARKRTIKKIKARMSLLVSERGAFIEIHDDKANTLFLRTEIPVKKFMAMMGRQSYVPVQMEVMNLEKIGKKHEWKRHVVEMPNNVEYNERKALASKRVADTLPEGWESDDSFTSQDSFFQKDGKEYAQTTIRRYV
jgi:hypothetical protein